MEGSFAPTAVAWGLDNRTCALRVVGHGPGAARREPRAGRRREPVPRGRRAHRGRPARHRERARARADASTGNAYDCGRAAGADARCATAAELFAESAIARAAFGDEVVEHYLNNARVELAAFDAAVTDWERVRGFERF